MSDSKIPNDIILYWYKESPYARQIAWYLHLRGIAFAQCMQPPLLPRPDMEALNVSYRRIPVLSIGKDIYCDTRLILKKLECQFPSHNTLGSSDPTQQAVERLLRRWTTDAGIFMRGATMIPSSSPMFQDPKFVKDREDFIGGVKGGWDAKRMERARPEALVHLRDAFELLETTLLADGREWVFKTEKPSLGDIEAIWPFHWLAGLEGALPPANISATQFPKVYAWIERFRKATQAARENGPETKSVSGQDVVAYMANAKFRETTGEFDGNDPLQLKPGDEVEVYPTDTGALHKDRGQLLTLTPSEVVIEKKTKDGVDIHVHMPRWGFRITKVDGTQKL